MHTVTGRRRWCDEHDGCDGRRGGMEAPERHGRLVPRRDMTISSRLGGSYLPGLAMDAYDDRAMGDRRRRTGGRRAGAGAATTWGAAGRGGCVY